MFLNSRYPEAVRIELIERYKGEYHENRKNTSLNSEKNSEFLCCCFKLAQYTNYRRSYFLIAAVKLLNTLKCLQHLNKDTSDEK